MSLCFNLQVNWEGRVYYIWLCAACTSGWGGAGIGKHNRCLDCIENMRQIPTGLLPYRMKTAVIMTINNSNGNGEAKHFAANLCVPGHGG